MLKYLNTDIVFQEVPDETSLAINITGCPCRCPGCHSPYLWADTGQVLDAGAIDCLMAEHGDGITCVCFMGGDQAPEEVIRWAEYIKGLSANLKTAWYSGRPYLPECLSANDSKRSVSEAVCPLSGVAGPFDYVKLGPYIESLGGLKSPKTNQRLYKRVGDEWQDITSSFWKKNL